MEERRFVLVTSEFFCAPEYHERLDVRVFCKNLLDKSTIIREKFTNVEFIAISIYSEDNNVELNGFRTETDEEFQSRIDAKVSLEKKRNAEELQTLRNLLDKHGLPEDYKP